MGLYVDVGVGAGVIDDFEAEGLSSAMPLWVFLHLRDSSWFSVGRS